MAEKNMKIPNEKRRVLNQGAHFRVWAMESDKGGDYIHCFWCKKDFLTSNITGKNGHENTQIHREKQKENEEKLKKENNQLKIMNEKIMLKIIYL